jgi:hypothetical protein
MEKTKGMSLSWRLTDSRRRRSRTGNILGKQIEGCTAIIIIIMRG